MKAYQWLMALGVAAIITGFLVKTTWPTIETKTEYKQDDATIRSQIVVIEGLRAQLDTEKVKRETDSTKAAEQRRQNRATIAFLQGYVARLQSVSAFDTSSNDSTLTFDVPVVRADTTIEVSDTLITAKGDTARYRTQMRLSLAYHFPPPMPGRFDVTVARLPATTTYTYPVISDTKIVRVKAWGTLATGIISSAVLGWGLAKDDRLLTGVGAGGIVVTLGLNIFDFFP